MGPRRFLVLAAAAACGVSSGTAERRDDPASQGGVQDAPAAVEYAGIGVQIELHGGRPYITRVRAESPLCETFPVAGYLVHSVDDRNYASLSEWGNALRGPPGTTVRLRVEPSLMVEPPQIEGDPSFEITVERARYRIAPNGRAARYTWPIATGVLPEPLETATRELGRKLRPRSGWCHE